MAPLRAESAAGGPRIPATRAGRPAALRLLLLLGAILKPQESVAQLLTTEGSLKSEGKTEEEYYRYILRCWDDYKGHMDSIKDDWCNWAVISSPYSKLQNCLENNAEQFGLGFPNPLAEEVIFETHLIHFANCSLQSTFSDPPEDVLLAMIIAPICLIPFLVTLVVWKSKDSEAQTKAA